MNNGKMKKLVLGLSATVVLETMLLVNHIPQHVSQSVELQKLQSKNTSLVEEKKHALSALQQYDALLAKLPNYDPTSAWVEPHYVSWMIEDMSQHYRKE